MRTSVASVEAAVMDVFRSFCDAVCNAPSSNASRDRLRVVREEARRLGLTGAAAAKSLAELSSYVDAGGLTAKDFAYFYRFVFFLARPYERKGLDKDVALQAWRTHCEGRFKFLLPWCAFVESSPVRAITEDTWTQVLEFNCTVSADFSNFDPSGAWPTMVDEFVEGMKAQAHGLGSDLAWGPMPMPMEDEEGVLRGCKRGFADVDSVTSDLMTIMQLGTMNSRDAAAEGCGASRSRKLPRKA